MASLQSASSSGVIGCLNTWAALQVPHPQRIPAVIVLSQTAFDLRVDPLAEFKVLVVGTDFIQEVFWPHCAEDSGGRSSNLQPHRMSSINVGSKDSSGANR
jgi:hypothetical protein